MDIEKLKCLYSIDGYSQREIARNMNISQTTVRYWLSKLGIKKFEIKTIHRSRVLDGDVERFCTKCKLLKKPDEFYVQNYQRSIRKVRCGSWCKGCMTAQVIERQRRYKQLALDYKGGKCTNCGFDKYQGALEFHHLDPSKKDFEMSNFSRHPLNEEAIKELDKCILLCANCHRMKHAGMF